MDPSKKKICLIIPTLNPGGIETYLLRFLRFLDSDDDITIVIRTTQKGALYKDYEALNKKLVFMPLGYTSIRNLFKYFNFFKKNKFDTICDFNANFAGIPIFLARRAGIKNRIAFYRQGKNHFKQSFLKNKYNRLCNYLVKKHATSILSNSQASLNFFFPSNTNDARFQVIKNGVDATLFSFNKNSKIREELSIPENAFVVVHTGRLDPAKNHPTIVEVAQKLLNKYDDIFFLLSGMDTEKINPSFEKRETQKRFITLGFRKDIPDILSAGNVYFFPSLTEGQPNALIEALLVGLPIVASNIAPIKETLPKVIHSNLTSPLDIDGFTLLIENTYLKNTDNNTTFCKEWAMSNYDKNSKFSEFRNCLY